MEIIEAFANLISEHGYATVLTALIIGALVWKGKSILAWLADTYNAAQLVKLHQQTIAEQKAQIQMMQKQIEDLNNAIMNYVEQVAILTTKLERYEEHFVAKITKGRRRSETNGQ